MKRTELLVTYGTDYRKMTYEVLQRADLAAELSPTMHIALKPNLVVAKKASEGATTTPAVVAGVIEYLQDHDLRNISIMEGSWVGDSTKRAFQVCGYTELAERYGIPLYDLKEDGYIVRRVGELELKVCRKAAEADFLINMPVLKAHCQTQMTCALKNLKGCIPDSEKRRFHSMGLMKPIGYLNKALMPGLTIVDAIAGDLTFEEGGNPVHMDRLIVGKDPVLIDSYAAELLGFDLADIDYIGIAERIGVGCSDLSLAQIYELNVQNKKSGSYKPSNKVARLTGNVVSREACSACFGSLVHALQRLDEQGKRTLLPGPIHIGQGFRGQAPNGLGVGQCLKDCALFVPGCPPTAKQILKFLEEDIKNKTNKA